LSKKTLTAIAGIIVLGLITVSGVLLYSLYGPSGQPPAEQFPAGQSSEPLSENSFPQTLGGMNLAQVASGDQAMGMISKLHGTEITVKQGFIAQYMGAGSQMTIWVSESNSEPEAVQLMDIMDKKMPASKAFTGRKEVAADSAKVIYVQGMGMDNYYWQKGTKVYWIAVGGPDSMQVLKEVLKSL